MLTYEQKQAVIETFPELTRKNVSLGRINYHYEDSAFDKKTVVYHLHPNGNGYVYAGQTADWKTQADDRGFVNIRDFDEASLKAIIRASIESLQPTEHEPSSVQEQDDTAEQWFDADEQRVTLKHDDENDMWMIFAEDTLQDAFESYEEAVEYLLDEGFARI
ncbi:hypothetical protein [Paenibacillus marinisediminis]